MGFRFRKSIKIAPGVKINIGKRGISSLSVGKTNIGKHGVYHTISIPGTGISYRAQIAGRSNKRSQSQPQSKSQSSSIASSILLQDDGSVVFTDSKGKLLPESLIRETKKQNRPIIEDWLYEQAAKFNAEIEDLIHIHIHTPAPTGDIIVNPKPAPPEIKEPGLTSKIFSSVHEKTEQQNQETALKYENELAAWEAAETALRTDVDVMSEVLSGALKSIEWPRETLVSYDLVQAGQHLLLDVDLPEIEDLPTQEAIVNKSQLQLTIRDISQKQQRLNYLQHIHSIGFRFIGEAFAYLPTVLVITLSGFSQRLNKKNGHIEDEYLYSVQVTRLDWQEINFNNLENVDTVSCFEQFDVRRKITANGIIKPIEPFAVS